MIDIVRENRIIRLPDNFAGYIPDMEKNFDVFFSIVEPEKENGKLVVDYSQPKLHTYQDTGLQFEISGIAEEPPNEYFRWYQPKPDDVIFDLGAYCGVSTWYFAQFVKQVYAFEPDYESCKCLMRNLRRHHVNNVIVNQMAVAGKDGTVAFNQEATLGSAIPHCNGRKSFGDTTTVPCTTLSSICNAYVKPNFIKMDIEGAEVEVLETSIELLKESNFQLVIANHKPHGKSTHSRVGEILKGCGYQIYSEMLYGEMTTWAKKEM